MSPEIARRWPTKLGVAATEVSLIFPLREYRRLIYEEAGWRKMLEYGERDIGDEL